MRNPSDDRIKELILKHDPVGTIKGGYFVQAIGAMVREAIADAMVAVPVRKADWVVLVPPQLTFPEVATPARYYYTVGWNKCRDASIDMLIASRLTFPKK